MNDSHDYRIPHESSKIAYILCKYPSLYPDININNITDDWLKDFIYKYEEPAIKHGLSYLKLNKYNMNVVIKAFECKFINISPLLELLLETYVASDKRDLFEYILHTQQFKDSNISKETVDKYQIKYRILYE